MSAYYLFSHVVGTPLVSSGVAGLTFAGEGLGSILGWPHLSCAGGQGGVFPVLAFWGTPYTWTYAMLTCIVCHSTLLYS